MKRRAWLQLTRGAYLEARYLWQHVLADIRRRGDPELLADFVHVHATMRDNPCWLWPSPMPGWGWA